MRRHRNVRQHEAPQPALARGTFPRRQQPFGLDLDAEAVMVGQRFHLDDVVAEHVVGHGTRAVDAIAHAPHIDAVPHLHVADPVVHHMHPLGVDQVDGGRLVRVGHLALDGQPGHQERILDRVPLGQLPHQKARPFRAALQANEAALLTLDARHGAREAHLVGNDVFTGRKHQPDALPCGRLGGADHRQRVVIASVGLCPVLQRRDDPIQAAGPRGRGGPQLLGHQERGGTGPQRLQKLPSHFSSEVRGDRSAHSSSNGPPARSVDLPRSPGVPQGCRNARAGLPCRIMPGTAPAARPSAQPPRVAPHGARAHGLLA